MVIIVQEPDTLVYHCVGYNIDDHFAIAVNEGNTTARLGLGHHVALLDASLELRNDALMLK